MDYSNYKFYENKLYGLDDKDKLCELLGLSKGYFDNKYLKSQLGYSSYINKKGRTIDVPSQALKKIQKKINMYISEICFPNWVISANKNVSYIDNAVFHCNNDYIINFDIKKFYNNCNEKYIYNMFFIDFCMSKQISLLMKDLVCKKGKLPTGAPSSKLISYLSYFRMFEQLNSIAKLNSCKMSVYVDDITISSSKPISDNVRKEIIKTINFYGLDINKKKTKYLGKKKNKKITGVIVDKNGNLKVPNSKRKEIIDLFKEINLTKDSDNIDVTLKKVVSLRGKLNACRNIEENIFPEIYRKVIIIHKELLNLKKYKN